MAIELTSGADPLQYTHFNTGFNPIVQTPPFTIHARVNVHEIPGALTASIYKIDRIPPGLGGNFFFFMLAINDALLPLATVRDFGTNATAYAASALELDTWNNIVGVFKSDTSRTCYLNGVAGTTETTNASPNPGLEGVIIGSSYTSTEGTYNRPYNGCLQDLTVWNIELTASEILQIHNGTNPLTIHATNIVLSVPFVDAASATVANEYTSGSALPVTLYQAGTGGSVGECPGPAVPDETGEPQPDCAEDFADAMSPCDVTWPECELVPGRISVDVVAPSVSPGRSFSGFEQLVQPDAGHWRIVFGEVSVRTRAHALRWREIESALNGRSGTVCVPVYEGVLSSTPIAATAINDAPIGSTSLDVEQTAGATVRAGMNFSAGEWLYRLTRITADLGSGVYTVAIWPPLREAIVADDTLNFNTPRLRCRLERDDGMDVNLELLRYARPSVTFVEDV